MKTIEVEDELYLFIMSRTTYRNETESSILRRMLGMNEKTTLNSTEIAQVETAFDAHLKSGDFLYSKGAVGKFLSLLGFIYRQDPSGFSRVEVIRGRDRLYFARDVDALNESGRSMNPKRVPGSPYWVTSNTPTALKQEILSAVMQLLGYSGGDIQRARSAIAD